MKHYYKSKFWCMFDFLQLNIQYMYLIFCFVNENILPLAKNRSVRANLSPAGIAFLIIVSFFIIKGATSFKRSSKYLGTFVKNGYMIYYQEDEVHSLNFDMHPVLVFPVSTPLSKFCDFFSVLLFWPLLCYHCTTYSY